MEPCGCPAVLRRGPGYLCPCLAETLQRATAAMALAWSHGTHPSAVHDPQHMYQHHQVAAHDADGAAVWRDFPAQGQSCCQCASDSPHDRVFDPCNRTVGWRGDQGPGAHC